MLPGSPCTPRGPHTSPDGTRSRRRGTAHPHGSLRFSLPRGGAALHKGTGLSPASVPPASPPQLPALAPGPAAPGREGRGGADPPPGAGLDSPSEAGGRCAPAPPWPPRAAPQRGISGYLFLTQHRAPALAWPAAASPPSRHLRRRRRPGPPGAGLRRHAPARPAWGLPGSRPGARPPRVAMATGRPPAPPRWDAALICMRPPGWLLRRRATAAPQRLRGAAAAPVPVPAPPPRPSAAEQPRQPAPKPCPEVCRSGVGARSAHTSRRPR